MSKQQWDIWALDFPGRGEHPAVLVSHPDRCARASIVNVLYCTSQRQSRKPYENEVVLNSADGLDWETFCVCDHMYSVERLSSNASGAASRRNGGEPSGEN